MRKDFATTRNVRAWYTAMAAIDPRQNGGRAAMALVHGVFGTGKTETAQQWAAHTAAPYIRVLSHMTPRSLLSAIVAELGEAPRGRSETLFQQARDRLLDRPQTLVLDEIDYLLAGRGVLALEVARDLYDCTGCPVVLVGMHADIDKKIKAKLPHLADRWGAVVRFEAFGPDDVAEISRQLAEVPIAPDACAWLAQHTEGRFRPLGRWIRLAERLHRASDLGADTPVTAAHLQAAARQQNGGAR